MGVDAEGALHHLQQRLSSSSCPVHFYCPGECLSRATKLANLCSLWASLGGPGTSDPPRDRSVVGSCMVRSCMVQFSVV